MSGRFPGWAVEAAEPTLAERRAVLQPGFERLGEALAEGAAPTREEIEALVVTLAGAPTRVAPGPSSVAARERARHVRRSRRARRAALALAAGVFALSLVGPLSRDSQALVPGERTALELRTLHTAGEHVVVAGRGALTLETSGLDPVLRLHEGRIEVAARGDAPVVVQVGPHTIRADGGRFHATRRHGVVEIVADEGAVFVDGPGGAEALLPGGDPWSPPPPEEVETCGGDGDPSLGPDAAPADPALSLAPPVVSRPSAGSASLASAGARSMRLGPSNAELGLGGRRTLASQERAFQQAQVAGRAPVRLPSGSERPAPRVLPMSGGTTAPRVPGAPAAPGPDGAPPPTPPPGGGPGVASALVSLAPGGSGTPTATVAHTVDLGAPSESPHHDSALGVCSLPAGDGPVAVRVEAPAVAAPPEAPPGKPRRAPQTPAPAPHRSASPPRTLPVPPGLSAGSPAPASAPPPAATPSPSASPRAAPAAPGAGAPPPASPAAAAASPLDQIVYGLPVRPPECEPDGAGEDAAPLPTP